MYINNYNYFSENIFLFKLGTFKNEFLEPFFFNLWMHLFRLLDICVFPSENVNSCILHTPWPASPGYRGPFAPTGNSEINRIGSKCECWVWSGWPQQSPEEHCGDSLKVSSDGRVLGSMWQYQDVYSSSRKLSSTGLPSFRPLYLWILANIWLGWLLSSQRFPGRIMHWEKAWQPVLDQRSVVKPKDSLTNR